MRDVSERHHYPNNSSDCSSSNTTNIWVGPKTPALPSQPNPRTTRTCQRVPVKTEVYTLILLLAASSYRGIAYQIIAPNVETLKPIYVLHYRSPFGTGFRGIAQNGLCRRLCTRTNQDTVVGRTLVFFFIINLKTFWPRI